MTFSSHAGHVLDWQHLQPRLALSDFTDSPLPSTDFWAFQPVAAQALSLFMRQTARRLFVLKADDKHTYGAEVAAYLTKLAESLPKVRSVFGVNYLIEHQTEPQHPPQIHMLQAASLTDNFAASGEVLNAPYYDQFQLFGQVWTQGGLQLKPGLVHRANGGVLVLNAAPLLADLNLWQRLKHILQSGVFDWYSAHPFKPLPCDIPSYPLELNVVLLANREELAVLGELDSALYDLADYAEIESYISVAEERTQRHWAAYVQQLAAAFHYGVDHSGVERWYRQLVRESEDRAVIAFSPEKWRQDLQAVAAWRRASGELNGKNTLSAVDFNAFFQQQAKQQGFLRRHAYADILNEQIYVATDGEMVGQINGLSVIEYPGTPIVYGEPSRLSCIVQFGEGELIDIERKNELAGNIHSKGMMIAQACLANVLELPSQLPFSASLVFEQSYSEIDGDSASLATFCVLTSALADLPLPQGIAVTGTIDQFGLVHAVGGVNEKIEGFFEICRHRGLTGNQGVMIPTATISQLSLSDAVMEAVKAGKFTLFVVEDIYQACNILFNRDLLEEDKSYSDNNEPLARVIQRRIALNAEPPKKNWLPFWR